MIKLKGKLGQSNLLLKEGDGKKGEIQMKKKYDELLLEVLLITEDVITTSPGDDMGEDIFG